MQEKKRLNRRLRPLYLAYFFQGFVLWYAVEKLFLRGIGFNDAQIALSGILVAATIVILQIPSGILADRWSRKGVLIVASILLILSTIVGGLSHDNLFYVSSILWGAFAALCFGTYDAVTYDTIEEETGHSDGYEHYYGRLRMYYSIALAAGALLSGITGELLGLRANFWLSVPFIALAIVALLKFKEPMLHKTQAKITLIKHTRLTFQAVLQEKSLVWIISPLILFTMLARLIDNLGPLWYLGFALPVIFWGPAYALLMMSFGFSGPVANFVKNNRFRIVTLALIVSLTSLLLISSTLVLAVIIAQAILLTGYGVFNILLNHSLHDALPSHIRAGASSTVATLAQLAFLPTACVIGWLSDRYSIFQAAWVFILLTMIGLIIFCIKVVPQKQNFAISTKDIVETETTLK